MKSTYGSAKPGNGGRQSYGGARPSYRGGYSTHGTESGGTSESVNGQAIKKIEDGARGRKYAETVDGKSWTKAQGGDWVLVKGSTPPREIASEDKPLKLFLTIQAQVPGEPQHWSLFVAKENERGSVYQVKGKQPPKVMHCIGQERIF